MGFRAPGFWQGEPGLAARLLSPLGALYGAATARRMRRAGTRVAAPVICVGNFTLGGAGKTPTVIALAKLLGDMGEKPFVLSRGYGGRERGPLAVDPARHDAGAAGDEPLEIVAHAPVIVARDRIAGARAAIEAGASVVLLDDGMQNPSLAKDATIVVIDGEVWFGNGFCAPAGPLRAPLALQLPFVDAALIIGGEKPTADQTRLIASLPRFAARLEPDSAAIDALHGKPVIAFAGIGRPEKFFAMLRAHGVDVAATHDYADHHVYSDAELSEIASGAARERLTPVTTVKDVARIGATRAGRIFGGALRAVPVALTFDDEAAIRMWLADVLARARNVTAPES